MTVTGCSAPIGSSRGLVRHGHIVCQNQRNEVTNFCVLVLVLEAISQHAVNKVIDETRGRVCVPMYWWPRSVL